MIECLATASEPNQSTLEGTAGLRTLAGHITNCSANLSAIKQQAEAITARCARNEASEDLSKALSEVRLAYPCPHSFRWLAPVLVVHFE